MENSSIIIEKWQFLFVFGIGILLQSLVEIHISIDVSACLKEELTVLFCSNANITPIFCIFSYFFAIKWLVIISIIVLNVIV